MLFGVVNKKAATLPNRFVLSVFVHSLVERETMLLLASKKKKKKTWLPQEALDLKKKGGRGGEGREGRGVRCGGGEHSPLFFPPGWSCNFFLRFTDTEKK